METQDGIQQYRYGLHDAADHHRDDWLLSACLEVPYDEQHRHADLPCHRDSAYGVLHEALSSGNIFHGDRGIRKDRRCERVQDIQPACASAAEACDRDSGHLLIRIELVQSVCTFDHTHRRE